VLGDNVIVQEKREDTAMVAAVLIGLTEGTLSTLDEVSTTLAALGCKKTQVERVRRTVEAYAAAIGRAGASRPTQDEDDGSGTPTKKGGGRKKRTRL
jgi:hypothetical protein